MQLLFSRYWKNITIRKVELTEFVTNQNSLFFNRESLFALFHALLENCMSYELSKSLGRPDLL